MFFCVLLWFLFCLQIRFCLEIHCPFSSDSPRLWPEPDHGRPLLDVLHSSMCPSSAHHRGGATPSTAHLPLCVFLDLPYLIQNTVTTIMFELVRLMCEANACGVILAGASQTDVASIHFLLKQLLGNNLEDDSYSATSYLL